MQIYLVGGAVRDRLLGLPVKDRDWVVVGATPEQMLAAGYKPVGRDFPVFLHPQSSEEYALARTERKSGKGYTGFTFHASPDITLEQDLQRRDLTINAIAEDGSGNLVDPYGGQQDLERRLLRHVSAAFSEDPLRVLRVARFAARFAPQGFHIAPETLALMCQLSAGDELDHLTVERVWQEFERALGCAAPVVFLEVLQRVGALDRLLPELAALDLARAGAVLARPKDNAQLSEQRFALLTALATETLEPGPAHERIETLCARLRIPNRYRDLALQLRRWQQTLLEFDDADASDRLQLIKGLDLTRRPQRLATLRPCVAALHPERDDFATRLPALLAAIAQLEPRQLMAEGFKGRALGEELERRQLQLCRSPAAQTRA